MLWLFPLFSFQSSWIIYLSYHVLQRLPNVQNAFHTSRYYSNWISSKLLQIRANVKRGFRAPMNASKTSYSDLIVENTMCILITYRGLYSKQPLYFKSSKLEKASKDLWQIQGSQPWQKRWLYRRLSFHHLISAESTVNIQYISGMGTCKWDKRG